MPTPPATRPARAGNGDPVRWLRAAVTAAVALSLGALAHTTAGGLLPGVTTMLAVAALATVGCWWVLDRPASTRRLVLLVVAVQAAGHGVLTAAAGHAGSGGRGPLGAVPVDGLDQPLSAALPVVLEGARRTGSLRDLTALQAAPAAPAPDLSQWWAHLLQDLTGPHVAMAAAHLVAAGLLGAWLAAGERALCTLAHLGGSSARATTARTVATLAESGRWAAAVLDATARPQDLTGHRWRTAYDGARGPVAEACRAVSRRGPPLAPALT